MPITLRYIVMHPLYDRQKKMVYNLTEIESFCREEKIPYERVSPDEVQVYICEDSALCFANIEKGTDTYLGFADSAWHSHGDLTLMTGPDTTNEFSPIEILIGLRSGEMLISTLSVDGKFKDRWIFHRKEKQDFQHLEANETISIKRADQGGGINSVSLRSTT